LIFVGRPYIITDKKQKKIGDPMIRGRKYVLFLVMAVILLTTGIILYVVLSKGENNPEVKVYFEKQSSRDKIIYIASDLHYLTDNLTDKKEAYEKYISTGDGKQIDDMDEILDAFSYDIKRTNPDILIISGDLTCNGEKESHTELAKKLMAIEKSGTSVYVIPGNHDILNPWARGFKEDQQFVTDSITPDEFSEIYRAYGYEEAISKDNTTLSYLAAPSDDIWLLMLDTNIYKDNMDKGYPVANGILGKGTLDWIEECSAMAKEKGASIITVMHHNILNHSEVIQEGYTLDNSGQAYIRFKQNNLNLVFSGHIHVQDISSDKKDDNTLYDIASGALSVNPHQYGVLQYSALRDCFDYSTAKVDVEGWAKKENKTNKNLLNFTSYSEEYFGRLAYNRAYESLSKDNTLTEDDRKVMADTMRLLNIRYFAGAEDLNTSDVINSKGYELLSSYPEGHYSNYVQSIISDQDINDLRLHIDIKR
jgi:3',5'-cyclic AMP phosphodiesterase CpdA